MSCLPRNSGKSLRVTARIRAIGDIVEDAAVCIQSWIYKPKWAFTGCQACFHDAIDDGCKDWST